jgi:hypothetical protein
MGILITSIILTIVTALFIITVYTLKKKQLERGATVTSDFEKNKKILKLLFVSPVWFLLILFGIFTEIGANQVGIVYDPFNGGIQDKTFEEGFHAKGLFETVIAKISTTNKTVKLKTFGQTKDSEYAEFQLSMTYRIEDADAGAFYRITGEKDITASHLDTLTKQALQKVVSFYDIYSILGSDIEVARSELEDELRDSLKSKYLINLIALSIDDVEASEGIESAIQSKSKAKQQLEIAQLELEQAAIDAETKLLEANNQAAVALIKAEASARSQEILNSVVVNAIQLMYISQFKGDLVAKEEFEQGGDGAYFTLQETANLVVKQLYYDTWDGKLPQVVTDKDTISIFFPVD